MPLIELLKSLRGKLFRKEKVRTVRTILPEGVWKQMVVKMLCKQLDIEYRSLASFHVNTVIQNGQILLEITMEQE